MSARQRSPHLLYLGDAGEVCTQLPADVTFDLVYLDPPFAVGSTMSTRDRKGQARGRKQPTSGRDAYHDGGDVERLIAHLEPRLAAIRDRMSDRATLYLHMDYRAVHDAKVAADRVFGRRAFVGDVVWTPGNGSRGARTFAVTHHTILLYARNNRKHSVFQCDHPLLREPYAATSLKMHFTKTDEDGRRYRERKIRGKRYRYYADEGRRLGSVWTDAPAMVANTPLRKEATGYPTQKPERLLERIIRAASQEGDTVADLMCGSGTTLVVAGRLGRRFVGSDQSSVAIEVTRKRLAEEDLPYRFAEASRCAKTKAAAMPR
ncbi:MAG: site-specific DNA-methyltransferase [Deltaproteobacteria bacterium]|nr:site-specific DNA-methyltransferase [Deltaproteobacteria bacterium]